MGSALGATGAMTQNGWRPRLLLAAYLLVCAAYLLPGASWHPVSRFSLTRAIVERHSLEITPYAGSTGDRAQVGERYYTDKAPVPSLLAVPAYAVFYAVARAVHHLPAYKSVDAPGHPAAELHVSPAFRAGLYVCSLSTAGLASAFLGVALYEVLRRRVRERAAMAAAIATVLGTPIFPYATSFFGHTIAAAFLFGAFALVVLGPERLPARRLALAGACLALAAGSEYIVAVPAALLGGFFVLRASPGQRIRAATWLALGALPPILAVAAYQQACFGAPWRTGYSFVTLEVFARGHAQGMLGMTYPKPSAISGLLFGRSRGLFYVAPVTAVGVAAGAVRYWRDRDRALLVGGLVLVVLLLANASYYMWNGGWATGPRHLVPAVAFVGLGIGLAFDTPRWRVVALIAGALGAWLMLMTAAVALEAPPHVDAIFDYLLPALRAGRIARITGASNLGLLAGLSRGASVVPLLVWAAAGGWWLTEGREDRAESGIFSARRK